MRTELIVSTYESPRALTLCLTSVAPQTVLPDSICIADDGSGPETKAAIDAFAAAHPELQIRHVWHEDRGFEKAAILNKAIATSEAEFLIFIDGDVLIAPVVHRAASGAGAAGAVLDRQPDPARRGDDGGRDAGDGGRRAWSSTAAGSGRTGRSTGSGPG